jgi:hypothetical protein
MNKTYRKATCQHCQKLIVEGPDGTWWGDVEGTPICSGRAGFWPGTAGFSHVPNAETITTHDVPKEQP